MVLALTLVLPTALIGFLAWAGYFSDDVFIPIPATAVRSADRPRLVAVYLSGDIGYRTGMGRAIGNRLAGDGIPVLAIDSLGYFRSHRTVAEVTALTGAAIRKALTFGHADMVVLIGHSFGADALQAGLPGLAPNLRAKVRAIVLIVPTDTLYLRISPGEMLGWSTPDGETLPTLRQLDWAPFTCIYGKAEPASPCPQLSGSNVHRVGLTGGHALNWDMNAVYASLLKAIDASAPQKMKKVSAAPHPAAGQ